MKSAKLKLKKELNKRNDSLLIAGSLYDDEDDSLCMEGGGSSASVNSISQAKKRERESKKRTECSVNSAAGAQVSNIVNTFTAPSLQYCSKLEEVCSLSTAIALQCQLDAFTLITM